MYDTEEIKQNYRNFPDEKIVGLARHESKSLRPEVLPMLKEEIIRRGLDKTLINWIDAESKLLSDSEKELLKHKIEWLPCPNCHEEGEELRGFEINIVEAFIIWYSRTNERKILCRMCGNKLKNKSIIITFLFGWWSRRGILFTPFILIKDVSSLFKARKISDRILNEFVEENIGHIRQGESRREVLKNLVADFNSQKS